MSLSICLNIKRRMPKEHSGIFVREDDSLKEITREEWDERNPGHEPTILDEGPEYWDCVFDTGITHNLAEMADQAGIYKHLWRPDEVGIDKPSQLIDPLEAGLALLKSNPDRFKRFNPKNGWGNYEGLVEFVEEYLVACRKYPMAGIYVSR